MHRYRNENPIATNKWQLLVKSVENNPHKMKEIVHELATQVLLDKERLDRGDNVSDCGLNLPRKCSSINKKTGIVSELAYELFPLEDKTNIEQSSKPLDIRKTWSYIRYTQLITRLTVQFKKQLEDKEREVNAFKTARKTGQRQNFCTLKKKPLSSLITDPIAMPVDVAPLDELQPFFDHMKLNSPVIPNEKSLVLNNGVNYLQFTRGAYYDDGRIDMCKQVVGSPWISHLMDSIKDNPYIDHFLLGNNIINLQGAKSIADFMAKCKMGEYKPKIQTWYLAGNDLNDEGIGLIAEQLADDSVCNALWLKRNPLKSGGVKHIADMIRLNKHMKILDLHNVGMLDEGAEYLFEALKYNETLRHLYVDANGLTESSAIYISSYFEYLVAYGKKGITSLWLDINRLDDEGIIILAKSLRNYTHLKRLVVGSNRITHVGIKVLLDALVEHTKLISLDFGLYKSTSDLQELPNNVGDEACDDIANFIRNNKSVQFLSIEHNNISNDGLDKINTALQDNKTILHFLYEQYGLDIPQVTRVSIKNKINNNVKALLNISYNDFIKNHLGPIKHSKKIKNIDSIYRNNM